MVRPAAVSAAMGPPSRALHGPLPVLLSLLAGYVDTASFLALHGLFTAHVTGNFVTLGAALVTGHSGVLAKLLALPVFCLVIFALRVAARLLGERRQPGLRGLLALQALLLVAGTVLVLRLAPGHDGDAAAEVVAGMVLVAAMALQNTASRVHLAAAPPTTMMTGTTTQVMIDLADLYGAPLPAEQRAAAVDRLARMGANLGGFAVGCGAAALLFHFVGNACFAVAPLLTLAALPLTSPAVEAPGHP